MRIWHRFGSVWDPDREAILAELGVSTTFSPVPGGGGVVVFRIAEDDPEWEQVAGFARVWGLLAMIETEFTREEMLAATYCALSPVLMKGYPQPEYNFAYRQITHETSEFCERCGMGLRQVAPYRMKAAPKWGRNSFMQLNWVFDEYFVSTEVWAHVLAPMGIGSRQVLAVKGKPLPDVLQLRVEAEVDMVVGDLPHSTCSQCGRTRYDVLTRGYLPPIVPPLTKHPITRTRQSFGSGANAFKQIIVTQAVAATILGRGLRGVALHPCANSP